MRILLDECMPRGLRRDLAPHQVHTVQELGFAGLKNGALLEQSVAAGIEVFLTLDRGIEYQQRVPALSIAIIAVRARSNDIAELRPIMPAVLGAITNAPPGRVTRVPSKDGSTDPTL